MANFNLGPRTAIAAVRDSLADIENWKKNGIPRREIVAVLNERYGLKISQVAFDKALYRLRKIQMDRLSLQRILCLLQKNLFL
ncbi:hypothetical protein ABC733_22640 [Mangrovibacter sp. SLW1]